MRERQRRVLESDIPLLFRRAYEKSASIKNAASGFSKTGIFPFKPEVFNEEDFLDAAATDIPSSSASHADISGTNDENAITAVEPNTTPIPADGSDEQHSALTTSSAPPPQDQQSEMQESDGDYGVVQNCDINAADNIAATTTETPLGIVVAAENYNVEGDGAAQSGEIPNIQVTCTDSQVNMADLIPYPKKLSVVDNLGKIRKRKVGHAALVTSSPYKAELISAKDNKKQSVNMKVKQMPGKEQPVKVKTTQKRRSAKKASNNHLEAPVPASSSLVPEREYQCIYCSDIFVDPPSEPWSQCSICLEWCHESCVPNVKAPFPRNFACKNCSRLKRRKK